MAVFLTNSMLKTKRRVGGWGRQNHRYLSEGQNFNIRSYMMGGIVKIAQQSN